jgi:hypothetical protein
LKQIEAEDHIAQLDAKPVRLIVPVMPRTTHGTAGISPCRVFTGLKTSTAWNRVMVDLKV